MAVLDDALSDLRQTVAALERQLEERTAERDEALARQTATSEILSVISHSPTDVQPVFEAIVARAARVCEAEFSAVARFADGLLHLIALNNMSSEETAAFHSLFPRPPGRHFVMGRAFVDAQPVHFDDVLTWLDYDPHTVQVLQSVSGYRSFVAVPIFRDSRPIGVMAVADARSSPSPPPRSISSRPSPTRPPSPLRTCASSASWKPATAISPKHWTSKRRPPRCCGSSIPPRVISRRYSTRSWRRRTAYAAQLTGACSSTTARTCAPSRRTPCRTNLRRFCGRGIVLPIHRRAGR